MPGERACTYIADFVYMLQTTFEEYKILSTAIETYGEENQIIVAIEELSELTKELTEYLRGNTGIVNCEHIAEEMADVYIMLNS